MENNFSAQLENLRNIVKNQKEQLELIEQYAAEMVSQDLAADNKKMSQELEQKTRDIEELKIKLADLSSKNSGLKNALHDQMAAEKNSLISSSKEKIAAYFDSVTIANGRKLVEIESEAKKRIDDIRELIKNASQEEQKKFLERIDGIESEVTSSIKLFHEQNMFLHRSESAAADSEYKELGQQVLTSEQIQRKINDNNVEVKIGSGIINTIGLLLILLGVVFGAQYTYTVLLGSDGLKAVFAFFIGILFLAGGEIMNRRERSFFSKGLTALGIGILFASTALSFFNLHVISLYPALFLCILTSVFAFVLSLRYDSQVIGAFALIGGYLPLFSLQYDLPFIYGSLVYFFFLNLFALLISKEKKWMSINFISFVFNSFAIWYVLMILPAGKPLPPLVSLSYVVLSFVMYMLIILVNPLFKKSPLFVSDIILLTLNTVFSCMNVYILLYVCDLKYFNGLFSVIFCAIFFVFAKITEEKIQDRRLSALFYLTSLVFGILAVPLQLGVSYLSLGWLMEAVALICYGAVKKDSGFEKAGITIFVFCLCGFILYDTMFLEFSSEFTIRYGIITLGSIIIVSSYLYVNEKSPFEFSKNKRSLVLFFVNAAVFNLWVFLCHLIYHICSVKYADLLSGELAQPMLLAIEATVTVFYAFMLMKIRILRENVVRAIPMFFYVFAVFLCFLINFSPVVFPADGVYGYIALGLLIAFNVLSVMAMRQLVLEYMSKRGISYEWCPLLVSIFALCLTIQVFVFQFSLEITNMFISFMLMVTAFLWIVFGFKKLYASMRRFGLVLALASTAKLFIIDLFFLSSGQRIVSYFVFGIVLVGISYVYQLFEKKLLISIETDESAS